MGAAMLDHLSLDLNPDRNEVTTVCVQDSSLEKKRLEIILIGIQTKRKCNAFFIYSFFMFILLISD